MTGCQKQAQPQAFDQRIDAGSEVAANERPCILTRPAARRTLKELDAQAFGRHDISPCFQTLFPGASHWLPDEQL